MGRWWRWWQLSSSTRSTAARYKQHHRVFIVQCSLGAQGGGLVRRSSSASRDVFTTKLDTSTGSTPTARLQERRHSSFVAPRTGPISHSVATVGAATMHDIRRGEAGSRVADVTAHHAHAYNAQTHTHRCARAHTHAQKTERTHASQTHTRTPRPQ